MDSNRLRPDVRRAVADADSLATTEECPSFRLNVRYVLTSASEQPPVAPVPNLPSNDQPTADQSPDEQQNALTTGGIACVDGVRKLIPPEGLTRPGRHDGQAFSGQCQDTESANKLVALAK
ncbi:hypothetical protein CQY20_22670 [Mycolicibacterium agri]|uniref:Uncharacterized protein n=1 Tax=Mycolicibacterium agri TaxID=36811 RepID=A0A2A7MUF8_MYCAG|nr:hypothetical protein CQY20_22670 [Mycolicibacterium agri]GFG49473.1 hypothetical protein MAGR_09140 [Mycolicibacterium agri]